MEEYLGGVDATAFSEDRKCQRAIERLLLIIGEAAKQLSDETRDSIPQPWKEIIRMRDKGIHYYDLLTAETVHEIATQSVPALRRSIVSFLAGKRT